MEIIGRLLDRLINLIMWIGMLAVALMMLQITIDVAGKYLFNVPIPATISLVSHYYMVFIAFLPLAFVEKRNGHISVEVLTELFPMRTQRHIGSWTYLVSVAVFGALTYRSWQVASGARITGTFMEEYGMKIITWPSYYLLPLGTGLMTVVLLYRFMLYVTGARSGLGETAAFREASE